jgi:carbon monoxide dehydrogenase subunit G
VQLENSFTVPLPIDDAWKVLLDVERIAPCMPGAALDSVTGDDFTGRVKVKLGPIALTYAGKGSFVEKDEAAHRAVIDAKGKDQRGNGTAAATITAKLAEEGSVTRVDVLTDLNITGRPAQFGRGVMTDVGNKLLGQFADKLAAQLQESPDVAVDTAAAQQSQEPTAAGAAAGAAATATGAVEEVASSAQQTQGDGAAASAVRSAAGSVKEAAAGATDRLSSATAPSSGPSGTTAPPNRPATSGPVRSTPAAAATPPAQRATEPEPIDLLEVAGGAAFTRFAAPAAGAGVLLLLVTLLLRRRSRRRR